MCVSGLALGKDSVTIRYFLKGQCDNMLFFKGQS